MIQRLTFFTICLLHTLLSFGQLAHTNRNNISTRQGQVLEFIDQTDLSSPRLGFGYDNDANCIYIVNGESTNHELKNSLEKYDPVSDSWITLSDKIPAVLYPNLVLNQDKLYVIGGVSKNGRINSKVVIYDLKSKKLSKGISMPDPTYDAGSTVWAGEIYIFGGAYGESKFSNKLFRYDPKNNIWNQLADMPEQKTTKGEIIDGKLYTIGGRQNNKASNSVDVYDISMNKWSHVFDLPVEVSAHATTEIDGKIWIIGNQNEVNYLASIDPINKVYIEYNSNMIVNSNGGCAYINNELYIFGGVTSQSSTAINNVQKLEM